MIKNVTFDKCIYCLPPQQQQSVYNDKYDDNYDNGDKNNVSIRRIVRIITLINALK